MYGQYSVHVVQIHFEFQIFSAIVSVYLTRWRSIRYYCSSASKFLVQIENWIYCDAWTIFSTHFINTLWVWNFHWYCIYMFHFNEDFLDTFAAPTETIQFKLKIEFIVMYGQYSVHVVQIHFEFQIFIAIVSVYLTRWYPSDIIKAPTQSFGWIWKLHLLWCMVNIQPTFYKYTLISNFHCNYIYMIPLNEDLSDICPAPTQTT